MTAESRRTLAINSYSDERYGIATHFFNSAREFMFLCPFSDNHRIGERSICCSGERQCETISDWWIPLLSTDECRYKWRSGAAADRKLWLLLFEHIQYSGFIFFPQTNYLRSTGFCFCWFHRLNLLTRLLTEIMVAPAANSQSVISAHTLPGDYPFFH